MLPHRQGFKKSLIL